MKKKLILLLLVLAVALPAMAADRGEGKVKVGALLGTPVAATVGFPLGDAMEFNVFAGFDSYYGIYGYTNIYAGANLLFAIADIDISGETFPLSFGPQGGVAIGAGYLAVDAVANIRWEYTFDFPLNLFVEAGLGVRFEITPAFYPRFTGTGGVGVRYVFD